jgi:glycosidase
MAATWAHDAIVYHVYPLGMCGAPARNDFRSPPTPRLAQLNGWIEHWRSLGINTLYLGPVFESGAHGYDTADYYTVDRRLGDRDTLAALTARLHEAGIRVILDAVLNHVGRDFWAFRDVLAHGAASPYVGWFSGLRFDRTSPLGDPFTYDTWAGAYDLVKLNLSHPDVRAHLFGAVAMWMETFGIDGLRLDAADVMDLGFLRDLAAFCRARKPDFYLVGEVVHGDYTRWANAETLDATTNYEAYKGLYSSHNDRNYFEIAHSLDRQFGPRGLYSGLPLYAFVDNHDVDRIASTLKHPPHLFPLHVLLFTMPGVPAIYYGSEWAIAGRKAPGSDAPLRPAIAGPASAGGEAHPLAAAIGRLARVRAGLAALRHGDYRPLHVASEQLAFARVHGAERVIVALNSADQPATLHVAVPGGGETLVDVLNGNERFAVVNGRAEIAAVPANWGRVLVVA